MMEEEVIGRRRKINGEADKMKNNDNENMFTRITNHFFI